MSSDMYQSGSVVAYAPASSANLSVGFDVLGRRSPRGWLLLGDRVQVKAVDVPFALSSVGRYAHKLPADPKKNILHDCWLAYGEALEKCGLTLRRSRWCWRRTCRWARVWVPAPAAWWRHWKG